jgi:N-acyl-D-aspartate/D-glutamate deacylase
MSLDLVLRGGTVVDGTGAPARQADVGVRDGRVVAIGTVDEVADVELDVSGQVVAPGFVDLHTHYDAQLLWDPAATPSPLHGVTTVLGGNCGFTIAPLAPGDAAYIRQMMAVVEGMPLASLEAGPAWDWTTFGEWLDRLDGAIAVNAGFLVGHSTLRRAVMGDAAVTDEATAEQVAAMVDEVHRAIDAGALGFSSSWGEAHRDGDGHHVPSLAAAHDELVALARAIGAHDGTTLEFIPCVGEIPEDRMVLMADMAAAAGRPLNWNLLGSLSPVEIYDQQLAASDVAAARGAQVVALALPDVMRLRMGPVLDALPAFAEISRLPVDERRRAVADTETRGRLRTEAERAMSGPLAALGEGNLVELAESDHWGGRTLAEVAASTGVDVIDVLLDVVLVDGLALTMVLPTLVPSLGTTDEGWAARVEVWKDPRVRLGGSDAGAHADMMCHADYPTVVLGEVVRDRGLLTIEEAVHMLSDEPARLYGLVDRGRLVEGAHADVVVFDPATVGTRPARARHDLPAGGLRLYAEARGVHHVLVGGVEIVRDGELTGATPGTVLRSGVDTTTAARS